MELLYRDIVLKIHRTNVYTAKNGSYIYSGLKQFIWLTRGGPSACRLGEGLTTPHCKKTSWLQNVTQSSKLLDLVSIKGRKFLY